MDIDKIKSQLNHPEKFHIHGFNKIASTNRFLARIAHTDAPEWAVVFAEEQSQGRGRYQRKWVSSASKNLLFSVLLKPKINLQYLNLLNLFTAYQLAIFLEDEVLEQTGKSITIDLKWPNDLFVDGKKICGILLETGFSGNQLNYVVVGIGLNINEEIGLLNPEISAKATSLKKICNIHLDREKLFSGFLNHYHQTYQNHKNEHFRTILDLYTKKVLFLGEQISVNLEDTPITGIFTGLTLEGYLKLATETQEKIITTGDVFPKIYSHI